MTSLAISLVIETVVQPNERAVGAPTDQFVVVIDCHLIIMWAGNGGSPWPPGLFGGVIVEQLIDGSFQEINNPDITQDDISNRNFPKEMMAVSAGTYRLRPYLQALETGGSAHLAALVFGLDYLD